MIRLKLTVLFCLLILILTWETAVSQAMYTSYLPLVHAPRAYVMDCADSSGAFVECK